MEIPDERTLTAITPGYFRYSLDTGPWVRQHDLSRHCEEQRRYQVWLQNRNTRGRKQSLCATFKYWLTQGLSREEAYQLALETQLHGLTPDKCRDSGINVDARTTWIPENPAIAAKDVIGEHSN